MLPRSWLYVPGDSDRKLERCLASGADAVIADLEDAVAPADRPEARSRVAAWLEGLPDARPATWVRISPDAVESDLRAVVHRNLAGVVVAKVDDPDLLTSIDNLIGELESARDLTPRSIAVSPRIESARGLRQLDAIAAAPRVTLLGLGEADLVADLGLEPGPDGLELLPARFAAVSASAAAGLQPPVGPASTNYRDLDALATDTAALRRLGFSGRTAIHPAQVDVLNAAFTPTAAQVAAAERTLATFAAGSGGAVSGSSGPMVDEAVARSARRVLDRARPAT